MPLTLHAGDIALRLSLTVLAGFLIGMNRGERGRPAGLRTTLLICLAASLSMIQVNLLLGVTGKASNSFVVLDLMRLPLGILSGMGFIGAGAILRRDNLVLGVTTASTLWFVTVVGLCFGGGQIALGLVALALGLVVLSCLKWVERRILEDRSAMLTLIAELEGPTEEEIRAYLKAEKFTPQLAGLVYTSGARRREISYRVSWGSRQGGERPAFLHQLAQQPGMAKIDWRLQKQ